MKDNDNHYSKTYGKYSWKPNIYTIFANKKSSYRLWTHDNIIYIIGPKCKPKWNTPNSGPNLKSLARMAKPSNKP